jgi:hypothetical protein
MKTTLKDPKELAALQGEKRREELAPYVDVGEAAVVAFLQETKLPDRVNALQEAAILRDEFFVSEAQLKELKADERDLVNIFNDLESVKTVKGQLKSLHAVLYKERSNPHRGIIPRIPPEGEMSEVYNELQAVLKEASQVYEASALVEVRNEIDRLTELVATENLRRKEQGEWNSGRKTE